MEYDEEFYVFCKNEADLEEFSFESGWETQEQMLNELDVEPEELLNQWFIIINSRVFFK
jgi:hypothetical protein